MQSTKLIMLSVVIACCSLAGCGDGGNKVIQPTETYQPTEQERENAKRIAEEMAKQRQ